MLDVGKQAQFFRSLIAAALILCPLAALSQSAEERSEGREVMSKWLNEGGPCLELDVELLFGSGIPFSGKELIFSSREPVVVARGDVFFRGSEGTFQDDEMILRQVGDVIVARGNVRVWTREKATRPNRGVWATPEPEQRHEMPVLERLEITAPDVRNRFELILKCFKYDFKATTGSPWHK